jgi:hypothetical protein
MNKHDCELDSPEKAYGDAVTWCLEEKDGTFWVGNGEYSSQVNYCPVCGTKAPTQVNPDWRNQ